MNWKQTSLGGSHQHIQGECKYHTFLLIYLLAHSMEQSPSWEATLLSDSQEIPPHFMEPEGSLPHSQVPATCPYPEPARSSPYPHTLLPEDPS